MASLFHRLHYQLSVSFFSRSHYNKYTLRRRPLVNIGRQSILIFTATLSFPTNEL